VVSLILNVTCFVKLNSVLRIFTRRYNAKGILWFWSTHWWLTVVRSALPYCVDCTVCNYAKQHILLRYNESLILDLVKHLNTHSCNWKVVCGGKYLRTLRRIYVINVATVRLQTTHLLIWMMCPSSTPLSFMNLIACCVQILRPNTFKSIIFFRSSGEPSAEHKCKLVPWKQLLPHHMRVNTVIRLLLYLTSHCEESLCTVLRVICVTGSVQDGSRLIDTANKVE
jgi:hypothetical protein